MIRVYLTELPCLRQEQAAEAPGRVAVSPGETHRLQSETARRLLMLALEREYPELAGSFFLKKDERGKPYLEGCEQICVSLSHSGSLAACAIGEKPVGVDVEQRKERPGRECIAKRFHPAEREWLAAQPVAEQERAFYDLWVRKESFLKAVGEGIRLRLDSFCVTDGIPLSGGSCGGMEKVRQEIRREPYYIRQYEFPGYSLAVCSEEREYADKPVWIPAGEFSLGG